MLACAVYCAANRQSSRVGNMGVVTATNQLTTENIFKYKLKPSLVITNDELNTNGKYY